MWSPMSLCASSLEAQAWYWSQVVVVLVSMAAAYWQSVRARPPRFDVELLE